MDNIKNNTEESFFEIVSSLHKFTYYNYDPQIYLSCSELLKTIVYKSFPKDMEKIVFAERVLISAESEIGPFKDNEVKKRIERIKKYLESQGEISPWLLSRLYYSAALSIDQTSELRKEYLELALKELNQKEVKENDQIIILRINIMHFLVLYKYHMIEYNIIVSKPSSTGYDKEWTNWLKESIENSKVQIDMINKIEDEYLKKQNLFYTYNSMIWDYRDLKDYESASKLLITALEVLKTIMNLPLININECFKIKSLYSNGLLGIYDLQLKCCEFYFERYDRILENINQDDEIYITSKKLMKEIKDIQAKNNSAINADTQIN